MATAYRHFLAGDDGACAAVDEQQSAAFAERADAARARNEQLQQARAVHVVGAVSQPCMACPHVCAMARCASCTMRNVKLPISDPDL